MGGRDGDRSVGCILPVGAMVIAQPRARRHVGRSRRVSYRSPRQRKLSPEQVEAIRASAANSTLRELAAEFGVSHETIRAAVRTCAPVELPLAEHERREASERARGSFAKSGSDNVGQEALSGLSRRRQQAEK